MTVSNRHQSPKHTYLDRVVALMPDPGLSAHQKSVPITVEDAENPQNKATWYLQALEPWLRPFHRR